MFRKLVSSLPFSPALVSQLGFYARRLKKEQVTRKFGLIFTVLALIMQSFAVFSPPDQALASGASDIIPGGVSSQEHILSIYDVGAQGLNDFKNLMDYFGVTREELTNLKSEKICSTDRSIVSFGRKHLFSASEGEIAHTIPNSQGSTSTFYSTPLYQHDRFNSGAFCTDAFVGTSAKLGWFSIMKKCGNFQIKTDVRRLPKASFISASCKTIQGYAYDERQLSQPVKIYLYFDGPPGVGKQHGPFIANQQTPNSPEGEGHGFTLSVPEEYQAKKSSTIVWGVMQPLAGWPEATVQMTNTVTIPGDCTPEVIQSATCSSLIVNTIERTKFSFTTVATVENNTAIKRYKYEVYDNSGKVLLVKIYDSNTLEFTSDIIELSSSAKYSVRSTIETSIGEKSSDNCNKSFAVSSVEKCKFNPDLDKNHPDCQPCPYNSNLWIKDNDCIKKLALAKEAKNITQGDKQASTTAARSGDRIEYTILTTNIGSVPITTSIEENLSDVLEYATVFQGGDGSFDNDTKTVRWDNVTIQPGQTDKHKVTIQINDVISATPRAGNNPSSYNCVLTNAYGNTIDIKVDCPPTKTIESTVQQLPSTGPGGNALFAGVLLMAVTYFYARTRQLYKETRLLRKEFNGSTL